MSNHQDKTDLLSRHATLCRYVNEAEAHLEDLEFADIFAEITGGRRVGCDLLECAEHELSGAEWARDMLDQAVLEAPIGIPGDVGVKAEIIARLTMWTPGEGPALFRRLADQVEEFARSDRAVPLELEDDREETPATA